MAFMKYSRAGVLTPLRLCRGGRGAEGQEDFRLYHNEIYLTPPVRVCNIIMICVIGNQFL